MDAEKHECERVGVDACARVGAEMSGVRWLRVVSGITSEALDQVPGWTHEQQLGAMVDEKGSEGYAAYGCPPSAWDRIYYALQACFPDATDEQHRLATDFIVGSELLS